MGQHLSRRQLHVAVRRLQGQRHGPGKRPERHLRIPADEERLDQHRGQDRQPLRNALTDLEIVTRNAVSELARTSHPSLRASARIAWLSANTSAWIYAIALLRA